MKTKLQFKFDDDLDFQLSAIQSVTDVFKGLLRFDTAFSLGDGTVPNLPAEETLSEYWLLGNVQSVQESLRDSNP